MSWHDIGEGYTLEHVAEAIRSAKNRGKIKGEIFTVNINIDNGYVRVDVHHDTGNEFMVEETVTTLEVR